MSSSFLALKNSPGHPDRSRKLSLPELKCTLPFYSCTHVKSQFCETRTIQSPFWHDSDDKTMRVFFSWFQSVDSIDFPRFPPRCTGLHSVKHHISGVISPPPLLQPPPPITPLNFIWNCNSSRDPQFFMYRRRILWTLYINVELCNCCSEGFALIGGG